MVIDARDTALNEAPKTFNRVRMNIAHNIDSGRVQDAVVNISDAAKGFVRQEFVGVNCRSLLYGFFHNWKYGSALDVGYDNGPDVSFALRHSDNRSLAFRSATSGALTFSPKVRLVNLYLSSHRIGALIESASDKSEHTPSSFISDAKFSLKLFGGNTTASLSNKIDRIEPKRERCSGFVEDRSRRRMDMVPAFLTAIGFARGH